MIKSICLAAHQAKIQALDMMRQRPYRNEVDTCFGIVAQRLSRDATAGLCLITSIYAPHRLSKRIDIKIVKHDTIHATMLQHLVQFMQVSHLDFYLEILAFLL